MDQLIADFQRATYVEPYNDSVYGLAYDPSVRGVRALETIPAGSCIGEIMGEPKYVWDVTHSEFIFIDNDMIVDVSGCTPRPVLTMIQENNQTANPVNCSIVVEQDQFRCETRVYVYATRQIDEGQELVYDIDF
jgi:hypothetical protein